MQYHQTTGLTFLFYLKKQNQACDSVHLSTCTQEVDTGESLQIQGRPPLHTEFQASLQNEIFLKQNQTKPHLVSRMSVYFGKEGKFQALRSYTFASF